MLCGPSFLKPNMIEDEKLKTMGPTRQTKMNEAASGMVLEIDVAFPVRN
jgi:tartrate dehydratase beta subunit/fumarate hydratase class I family protein